MARWPDNDHARSTIGDLRRRASGHRTAFGVECRLERRQTFEGGFRTNGLVVIEDFEETVLVIPLHRDDFVLELALDRGLVSQLMRAQREQVLLLASDAVHLAEHFGSQAHHAGGLGRMQ